MYATRPLPVTYPPQRSSSARTGERSQPIAAAGRTSKKRGGVQGELGEGCIRLWLRQDIVAWAKARSAGK